MRPRTQQSSPFFVGTNSGSSTPLRERRQAGGLSDRGPWNHSGHDTSESTSVSVGDDGADDVFTVTPTLPSTSSSSSLSSSSASASALSGFCCSCCRFLLARRFIPPSKFCRIILVIGLLLIVMTYVRLEQVVKVDRREVDLSITNYQDDVHVQSAAASRRHLASTDSRRSSRRSRRRAKARSGSSHSSSSTTTTGDASAVSCHLAMPLLNVSRQHNMEVVARKTAAITEAQLEWRRLINTPDEQLQNIHLTVLPFVSSMQWRHGVYGSVGQLQDAGLGKLTSLLAQNVDIDAGERLFVADSFSDIEASASVRLRSLSGILSRYDVFAAHLRDVAGFAEHHDDPARRIVVHRRDMSELTQTAAHLGVLRDLPKFRLVVVGVRRMPSLDAQLDAIELAACLIRDGGLIVLELSSTPSLDKFFVRYGRSIITPILSSGNLLYLTTSNFRSRYIQYVGESDDWLLVHVGRTAVKTTTAGVGLLPESGVEFLRL